MLIVIELFGKGLDSFTANNIVTTLVQLARGDRTVLCTIHQRACMRLVT